MNLEFSQPKSELPSKKELEIPLESEENFIRLENWLQNIIGKEEAGQCVFVLRSMAEMDFINQCQKKTQEFGKRLSEQFGGEESFFDLVPSANFYDVRSYRHKAYHSVGLLEFNSPNKQPSFLIFDLAYGTVSGKGRRKDILVLYASGPKEQAMEKLKDHRFGGSWKIDLKFNKRTGQFVSYENRENPVN